MSDPIFFDPVNTLLRGFPKIQTGFWPSADLLGTGSLRSRGPVRVLCEYSIASCDPWAIAAMFWGNDVTSVGYRFGDVYPYATLWPGMTAPEGGNRLRVTRNELEILSHATNKPLSKITIEWTYIGYDPTENAFGEVWRGDLTAQKQHITSVSNPATVETWPLGVSSGSAIGQDGETVAGCDVYRGTGSFTVRKYYTALTMPAQLDILDFGGVIAAMPDGAPLCPAVNTTKFSRWAPGCVLLLGVNPEPLGFDDWFLTYSFNVQPTPYRDPITIVGVSFWSGGVQVDVADATLMTANGSDNVIFTKGRLLYSDAGPDQGKPYPFEDGDSCDSYTIYDGYVVTPDPATAEFAGSASKMAPLSPHQIIWDNWETIHQSGKPSKRYLTNFSVWRKPYPRFDFSVLGLSNGGLVGPTI